MKTIYLKVATLVFTFLLLSSCSKDDPAPAPITKDIYACGYEFISGKYVAKYWKNGTAVTLTDGTRDAVAFDCARYP